MAKRSVIILCQVIDNYGDAGFCLRLARSLAAREIQVSILSDRPEILFELMDDHEKQAIPVAQASQANSFTPSGSVSVIHPFGTSAPSPTIRAAEEKLRASYPDAPWLIVDYLSAEPWIDDFHLSKSLHPTSGAESLYIYPGFSKQSGGVILDLDISKKPASHKTISATQKPEVFNRIFCFCYEKAPLKQFSQALLKGQTLHIPAKPDRRFRAKLGDQNQAPYIQTIDFVPQSQFDNILGAYDFVFVRGEDSFLRAQLLGLPLVWQIYPTPDKAHWAKLEAFYERYSENLTPDARATLWQMWCIWNGQVETSNQMKTVWSNVCNNEKELIQNAKNWSSRLKQGKNLVEEIIAQLAD